MKAGRYRDREEDRDRDECKKIEGQGSMKEERKTCVSDYMTLAADSHYPENVLK